MKKRPDICLVLEGTYPFVKGGVSSWVHHLVTKLPHLRFHILHISPHRGFYHHGPRYQMPPNVIGLEELYLHDYGMRERRRLGAAEKVERFRMLVRDLMDNDIDAFEAFVSALDSGSGSAEAYDLLQTFESWDVLVEAYGREASEESFLNFFWNWRYTYLPLFNVLGARAPKAHAYHPISTGYAGILAAAAKIRNGGKMLVTEHGIYTKERRIEINRAEWIQDWDSGEIVAERTAPYFKRYWRRTFGMMSQVTYRYADSIYTLYGGNRVSQIKDGADAEKIRIIPNGIDLERFGVAADVLDARGDNERFTVGFIGRVSPIKDLKTFIYAMRLVADKVPTVKGRILGPMDESPEYADECTRLAGALGLNDNLTFEGPVDVVKEMPTLDVVVLTSISEAQPLVILEAGAVGIPTVATNVGSCHELLNGRTLADMKIGSGGLVTPIFSPGETARAILEMHDKPEMRKEMGMAMRQRVRTFYTEQDMLDAYDQLYRDHLPVFRQRELSRSQALVDAGLVAADDAALVQPGLAADAADMPAMDETPQGVARAADRDPAEEFDVDDWSFEDPQAEREAGGVEVESDVFSPGAQDILDPDDWEFEGDGDEPPQVPAPSPDPEAEPLRAEDFDVDDWEFDAGEEEVAPETSPEPDSGTGPMKASDFDVDEWEFDSNG